MKLTDLERMAKDATNSADRVVNAMAEKYPLGTDFGRYQDDIRNMVKLCDGDTFDALIALVRKQNEALKLALDPATTGKSETWNTGRAFLQSFKDFEAME